jgi:hypothetical protein
VSISKIAGVQQRFDVDLTKPTAYSPNEFRGSDDQ